MSCGNRFQCGLSKSSRFQFKPDKPSNPELHNENQKRLNELLKAREEIDKQFFSPSIQVQKPVEITNIEYKISESILANTISNSTPWKIPSSQDYKVNQK